MKASLFTLIILSALVFQVRAQNTYIWKPQGGSTSAKTVSNWKISSCNGSTATSFPGSSDTLIFYSCSNTNASLDTNFVVSFVNLKSTYTGTVTLAGSNSLTANKVRVSGGVFSGGSGTININTSLAIDGGTFTSTSGIFTLAGVYTKTGGTFNHNNGKIIFKKAVSGQPGIGSSSKTSVVDFYDVVFDAPDATTLFSISNIFFTVNHSMEISGDEQLFINGDTILMATSSNLILSNTSNTGGGTAEIKFNSSSTQSITGNTETDYTKLPNLIIAKSGTLNLSGNIAMGGSTCLDYRSGTISEGTSSFLFYHDDTIKGKMRFYDVEFQGHSSYYYLTDTISVYHDLLLSGTANNNVNNGVIKLYNNLIYNNSHSSSIFNSTIQFANITADQIILGSHNARVYDLVVNKSNRNLILQKPTTVTHSLILIAGYLKTDATNLVTLAAGCTVSGGSSSSFVKGPMKKIGNTSFIFPLGGGTSYKPLSITAPSSATDAFTAEYFNTIQPWGLNRSGLTFTSMCEYWNLVRSAGTSNVSITLTWDSNSCDIYTLSTLRIGRWNGTAWADVGSVSTSGSTSSGTITTSSSQSSFGYLVIAKNSPAVSANAGSNATISIGSIATLGGSPSASGGVTPYTYEWITEYALDDLTEANPSAQPFSTYAYCLKVTDLDQTVDLDTVIVTVSGFDLKTTKRFPLLSQGNITVSSPVDVVGAVGTNGSITGTITATDSILISTTSVSIALDDLDTIMMNINGLTGTTINAELGSNTRPSGVYRIAGNATLNGTLTLEGDENSFFVFDINGSWSIASGASIVLSGVSATQVYFNVQSNTTVTGTATINGYIFGEGNFTGTVVSGNINVLVNGYINGTFPSMKGIITPQLIGEAREIDNFLGYNAAVVIRSFGGLGDTNPPNDLASKVPLTNPWVIRYPGGSDANWWRWQSGWFRGYDNPLYSESNNPQSAIKYGDDYPLPSYAPAGLSPDNNGKKPQLDYFLDFKKVTDAASAIPIFDLNMMTSDLGTEIGFLFDAHCSGLPIKYVELGNEFYFNGDQAIALFPNGGLDYATMADEWAEAIKTYFPEAKVAIVATTTEGTDPRRIYWNQGIADYITNAGTVNFDAVTYHVYPNLNLDAAEPCGFVDQLDQVMARPFETFDDYENDGVYCPNDNSQSETQPEFSLLNTYGLEGWITEYNIEDKKFNLEGTWVQTMFVAAQTLRSLRNPDITHATAWALLANPGRGVWLDDLGYSKVACVGTTPTSVAAWAMGATGYATKYAALAMKDSRYAQEMKFPNSGILTSPDGCTYDGVYGWLFSNGSNLLLTDRNYSIILNLTGSEQVIDASTFFPYGGNWKQITRYVSDPLDIALSLDGSSNEVPEVSGSFPALASYLLTLKPYSITIIDNKVAGRPATHHMYTQLSNSTTCPGGEVTIYGSGAGSYLCSQAGSTFTRSIKVNPQVTTTYSIYGIEGNQFFGPSYQTVTVGALPTVTPITTHANHCPGDEVTLNMTSSPSGLLYNWYPFESTMTNLSGDPSNASEDVKVYPDFSTLYTLNVTNSLCYCAKNTITAKVVPKADAGDDLWLCSNSGYSPSPSAVTIGTINYPTNTTVTWSLINGNGTLTSYSSATPSFSTLPTITSVFKLQVVFDNGVTSCTSEDQVTVYVEDCCIGPGGSITFYPFHPDYLGTNLTAFDFANLVPGALYTELGDPTTTLDDVGSLTNHSGSIYINGPFNINLNLTITDCPNLKFGPDASIYIEPNCQLILDNCTLKSGCEDYMWNGITIDGNLFRNIDNEPDNGLILGNTSWIQDAKEAVNALHDSRLLIHNAKFWFNHNHVSLTDYNETFFGSIDNSDFISTGYASNMLPPYSGLRTDLALSFNNVYSTAGVSNIPISTNNIVEADIGISALGTGLFADANTIQNVIFGIYVFAPKSDVSITDNSIDDFLYGVLLYDLGLSNVAITDDNEIGLSTTLSSGSVGILHLEFNGSISNSGTIQINNNRISNFGAIGIADFNGSNLTIKQNIPITLDQTSPDIGVGIFLQNTKFALVTKNTITGFSGYGDKSSGISLTESPNCIVHCNDIDYTYYGVQMIGHCIPFQSWGNTFNNHTYTFTRGEDFGGSDQVDGFIGIEQPDYSNLQDDSYVSGNMYLVNGNGTTSFDLYAFNNSTSASQGALYYVKGSGGENGAETNGSNTTDLISISTNNLKAIYTCNLDIPTLRNFDSGFAEEVIDGSYNMGFDGAFNDYNFKLHLYEELRMHPDWIDNSTIQDFCDTVNLNPMGQFYRVDSLIAVARDTLKTTDQKESLRLSALSINEEISPRAIFESNQKTVNNIYLETVAVGIDTFSSGQGSDLFDIANQCPFHGGQAVFEARALLILDGGPVVYDDQSLCSSSSKIGNSGTDEISFSIFPNPSNGKIKLEYNLGASPNGALFCYDAYGSKIFFSNLEQSKGNILLDLSEFSSGLYFIAIESIGNYSIAKSFTIIK